MIYIPSLIRKVATRLPESAGGNAVPSRSRFAHVGWLSRPPRELRNEGIFRFVCLKSAACDRYAGARPPRCYSALAPADDLRVRPIPARVTLYARPRPEMAREARARPRSLRGASDGIMKRSNALKRPILLESGLILLLALVCCRAPRAAEFSYTPPNLVESRASATATGHRAESGPEKWPARPHLVEHCFTHFEPTEAQ